MRRKEAKRQRAIYKQHIGFFELALTHFDIPYDAATIAHRAALQDHAYMADRMEETKEPTGRHAQVLARMQHEERRRGVFALPANWYRRQTMQLLETLSSAEATVEREGMFAIPHHMMVPGDGSYPPGLGATRMLDMMVEAGIVLREEPASVERPAGDDEHPAWQRPPEVRYWGLAQAAASAARRHRAQSQGMHDQ